MRALSTVLLSLVVSGGCAFSAQDSIEWLGSYREGLQRARQTGKPILVEFRCEA